MTNPPTAATTDDAPSSRTTSAGPGTDYMGGVEVGNSGCPEYGKGDLFGTYTSPSAEPVSRWRPGNRMMGTAQIAAEISFKPRLLQL